MDSVWFLRRELGEPAVLARQSSRYTAAERSRAIDVLRGVVLILKHPYDRDPASGAGNCWCGRDEHSILHDVLLEPES